MPSRMQEIIYSNKLAFIFICILCIFVCVYTHTHCSGLKRLYGILNFITIIQFFCWSTCELIFYGRIQLLICSAAISMCAFLYNKIIFLY